jgi:hypothetical protein
MYRKIKGMTMNEIEIAKLERERRRMAQRREAQAANPSPAAAQQNAPARERENRFHELDVTEMRDNTGMKYGINAVYFENTEAKDDYHDAAIYAKHLTAFKKSVRANTDAILRIETCDNSDLDHTLRDWYACNELKARKWAELAQKMRRPTVFMDIDIVVLGDLVNGFQSDGITITRRDDKSWFNSGAVWAMPTKAVKEFFAQWYEQVKEFYGNPDRLKRVSRLHVGLHQTSFISLLSNGLIDIDVKVLDGVEWNNTRCQWDDFSDKTRVLHATKVLRKEAFINEQPTRFIAAANELKRWSQ